ncbi:hypothetical protein T01_12502 [Trichinella spiralis]|uniref:Uncharacterized protein n=1 Tax=Trichinella spiralis TaxID=6334 RepID=A0A0V1B5W6_TRISP|nr:hypothetical protein T01_12502 [Trichinella spiralis]
MRYSFTFCTLVQYFVVLGNLIFLHFRSISNKLKKVQMLIRLRTLLGGYKSAFVLFRFLLLLLKSHRSSTFFSISRQIRFHEACDQQGYSLCCFCDFRKRFWKVLRQINPYVSNKWSLKLPCAYLNT